jgi:hypothetical protein
MEEDDPAAKKTTVKFEPLCDTTGFTRLVDGLHYTELRANAMMVHCRECDRPIVHLGTQTKDWPMEYRKTAHELATGHRCLYVISEAN